MMIKEFSLQKSTENYAILLKNYQLDEKL